MLLEQFKTGVWQRIFLDDEGPHAIEAQA